MKRLALAAMIVAGTQFAGTNAEYPTQYPTQYPSSLPAQRVGPGQSYVCPCGHLHLRDGYQSPLVGIPVVGIPIVDDSVVNDSVVTQGPVSYPNSGPSLLTTTPPLPATANDGLPVVAGSTSKSSFTTSQPPEATDQTTRVEIGTVHDEVADIAPAKAIAASPVTVRPNSAPQSDPDAVKETSRQIGSETVRIEPIERDLPEPTAAILAESTTKPEAVETPVKQTTQQSVSADQPAKSTLADTDRTHSSSRASLPPSELDDETQVYPIRSLKQEIAAYFAKVEREALRARESMNADLAARALANKASEDATAKRDKSMAFTDKADRTEVPIPLSNETKEPVVAQTQVVAKTPDGSQPLKTRRETSSETQRQAVEQQLAWSETEIKAVPPKTLSQGSLHRDQLNATPALGLIAKENAEATITATAPTTTTPVAKTRVAGKVATAVKSAGSQTDTVRSAGEATARQTLTATGRPWWWLPSMLLAPCGIWALSRRRFGKKKAGDTDLAEADCEIDRTDRPHSQVIGHSDSVQSGSVQSDPVQSDFVQSDSVQSDSVRSVPVQRDFVQSESVQSDSGAGDSVRSETTANETKQSALPTQASRAEQNEAASAASRAPLTANSRSSVADASQYETRSQAAQVTNIDANIDTTKQPERANGPEQQPRQAIAPFDVASLAASTPQANTLASSNFDDFAKIDGVDSRTSAWLHGQGFHRFEHLKEADPTEIQRRLCDWNPEYQHSDVGSWIQRAGIAQSNSERQDQLEISSSDSKQSRHEARVESSGTWQTDESSRRRSETIEQTTAQASQPDDLTRINGIGPAIEKLLRESGIRSYRDLADADPNHLQKILHSGGARFKLVDSQTWAHQAEMACNNDGTARKLRTSHRQQNPAQQNPAQRQKWTPDSTQISSPDDLTLISGIGPATQDVLNENGIYRLEQIAVMSEQHLSEMFEGHFNLVSTDSWASQATALLSQMGDMTVESNLLREVRALKNSKTSDVPQRQLKE